MGGTRDSSPAAKTMVIKLENGVKVELLVGSDGQFDGLGLVSVGGVNLRGRGVPLRPHLKSTRGMVYTSFRFERIEDLPGGGKAVHTVALGHPMLEGEYEDEYSVRVMWPTEKARRVEDRLVWVLRPEQLEVGGLTYRGFSYAWRFSSATERVFRIVAVTTWELGGRAEGNTLLSLGQVTPPVYTAEKDTGFTSACLKQLNRFGDPLGMSFQFSPRYSPQQCFDFQAGPLGSLLGYWPDRADVRSFVQKNPGEDVIFILDATHFTEASQVEIARKCIVFAPAAVEGLPDHEMRNRWKDAHDFCQAHARTLFGIRRSRPLPEATIGYDQRLEKDGRLLMRVGNSWVPSQEWLIAMADTYFAELASRGIRRVIPEPIMETDPTQRGLLCKLNSGIHGDLNVGSVCCAHRYRPSEFWGGMKAWRYYYEKAHQHGMEAGHWIGPHLSHHAPILQEHPDWGSFGVNTLRFAGGYPNFELACLNFNTGVRQWLLDDLKRWKEEGGLDYVWFELLGNLGFIPVDYAQQMAGNAAAISEFIAGLQSIGIENIEVEGMSPFGVSAAGVFDPNQGAIRDTQGAVVGQNTWDWFVGNEDMFCDQMPRVELHRDRDEEQCRQMLFRCLANRCVPMLGRFSRGFGPKPAWFKEYLDNYLAVEGDLVRRYLLPSREGVRWTGGKSDILFSYASVGVDVSAGGSVVRIASGKAEEALSRQALRTEPWSVYRISRGR